MELLWMILLLFLLHSEAENLTEVRVQLGHSVTLNCSLKELDTYWSMQITSQVRGSIARTYSSDPARTKYYVSPSTPKYLASGNSLMIGNITADDYRLYFCGRRQNDGICFVDTFRLVSDVCTIESNSCRANDQQQHSCSMWQSELVTYSSFALNLLLTLTTAALVGALLCLKKKKKNCNHEVDDPSPVIYENELRLAVPQYEELQLPPITSAPPDAPPEVIYYRAQLPHSTPPRC